MRTANFAIAAVLLASTAHADIITAGTWKGAPPPCECGDTPYSNTSLDGKELNAGFVLAQLLGLPDLTGVEYLDAADGFTVETTAVITEIYSQTAYASVMSVLADGRVQMDDGKGNVYWTVGYGRDRFTAFRLPDVVTAIGTYRRRLWCGEDLEFPDRTLERGHPTFVNFGDCNDHIAETTEFVPFGTPRCVNCEPPPVGEPGTLALVLLGLSGLLQRRLR